MPRLARIVLPGVPHHITQRGNNQQDVFFVDDDRRGYLDLLREQSDRFGLKIEGYCLMANHVHLVGTTAGRPGWSSDPVGCCNEFDGGPPGVACGKQG